MIYLMLVLNTTKTMQEKTPTLAKYTEHLNGQANYNDTCPTRLG